MNCKIIREHDINAKDAALHPANMKGKMFFISNTAERHMYI